MKRHLTLALGLAITLLGAGPTLSQTSPTIRIATDGESPPYSLSKPDGSTEGFEVEYARSLCDKMQVKCTVEVQDFSGMIPALNAGKFDVIMASMSITKKREEAINFSIPYGGTGNVFATMKGSPLEALPGKGGTLTLTSENAAARIEEMRKLLKGKAIGVQTASVSAEFAKTYFKDVAEIREYQKNEEINLDLIAGRVDVEINGRSFLHNSAKAPGFQDIVLIGPLLDGGVFGGGVGLGFRKSDTDLKAKFDAAIRASAADGTLKALSMKWFGFDITPSSLR
ncbi:transporter substrate-binding domain-containing protein [Microvirga sp. CF3062]|uniref:transporter substrate-binding domain-containing protein n=1 Tax=Microvirga sp. CF3062 TaxID=3110182 RepID=UPI002E766A56|nr:transporter substrate-binding domain-containing protein [Microvirga sp. CF3062]MEE1655522.1 transporter substrate-binding domain-containing protein [Microvirga sp. CF3062]